MPTPDKPSLDYSYTAFQESQGDNSFPGTQLDNDLANIVASLDETIDFVGEVIRDDGQLQNGIVTKASLDSSVQLGVAPPRPWVAGTEYALDDTVTINNSLYIALSAHEASGSFATDLAGGLWALLIEFTVPAAIADGAVTEPKHATGGVSTRALADLAVTAAKVANGTLTRAKMAPNFGLTPIGGSMEWDGPLAPAGWMFKYGQALSRATYIDLLNALTAVVVGNVANASPTITGVSVDLRGLGLEGAPIEGPGVPGGATVSSVTINTIVLSTNAVSPGTGVQLRIFPHGNGDGSTTFNLPDDRDRASVGRGNMGGTAANRITASGAGNPGLDTTRLGVAGGVDRHALVAAQVPALSGTTSTDGAHTHDYSDSRRSSVATAQTGVNFDANVGLSNPSGTTTSAGDHSHTVTVNPGGGQAHPNVQPSRATNKIIFTGVV